MRHLFNVQRRDVCSKVVILYKNDLILETFSWLGVATVSRTTDDPMFEGLNPAAGGNGREIKEAPSLQQVLVQVK
jgi:hypothetical protein